MQNRPYLKTVSNGPHYFCAAVGTHECLTTLATENRQGSLLTFLEQNKQGEMSPSLPSAVSFSTDFQEIPSPGGVCCQNPTKRGALRKRARNVESEKNEQISCRLLSFLHFISTVWFKRIPEPYCFKRCLCPPFYSTFYRVVHREMPQWVHNIYSRPLRAWHPGAPTASPLLWAYCSLLPQTERIPLGPPSFGSLLFKSRHNRMTVDFHLGIAINTKLHMSVGAYLCAHMLIEPGPPHLYIWGENIAVFVCNLPRHSKKMIVENEFRNQKYAWQ